MNSFINKLRRSQIGKYALVQLLSKALTLLSTYIIALSVSNTVFGYVTILQASLLVCVTIFGLNLQNAFIRYFFEKSIEELTQKTLPIYMALLSTAIIASGIIAYYFYERTYFWFALLPLIGFGNSIILVVSILARANHQLLLYANSELIRPFSIIILSIVLMFNPQIDIIKYYIMVLFLTMLIALIMCFAQKNKLVYTALPTELPESNISTRSILLYTLPLFMVVIMSLINNVSDRYILQLFVSISEVGLYGKAYLLGSSFGLFFDSLMLLWTPFVMKNKHTSIIKNLPSIQKIVLLVLTISVMLFVSALVLRKIAPNLFNEYTELIVLTILICSAFIARIGYQIASPIFNAYDKTPLVAKISLASMLVGLIFNIVMIPHIGILGAAIATYLSFVSFSLLSIIFLYRFSKNELKPSIK